MSRVTTLLHSILALAFLLRSLVAPGYMPGVGGWPLQLCPDGLTSAQQSLLLGPHGEHEHHGHQGDPSEDNTLTFALEHCAVGAALSQAAAPMAGIDVPAAAARRLLTGAHSTTVIHRHGHPIFLARAPPRSSTAD